MPLSSLRKNEYSVVIPAHNAESFLANALASVQQQTRPCARVCVVDDGSTDGTRRIAEAHGAHVIVHATAKGPAAARNAGVAATQTEFVAFLDADDEWEPVHAERSLAAFDDPQVVFSSPKAVHIGDASGVVRGVAIGTQPVDVCDTLLVDNPVIQSGAVVRRDVFDRAGGYDEGIRYAEDYDLWGRVAELGLFMPIAEHTVRRRVHAGQVTVTSAAKMVTGAWTVRTRMVQRRLAAADPVRRDRVVTRLRQAAMKDVEWAVWMGDIELLRLVRGLVSAADETLQLAGALQAASTGGHSLRRLSQDVRCRAYKIRKAVRSSYH